jgi:hypothetical protein
MKLSQRLLDRIARTVTLFGIWLSNRGISIARWGNRLKGRRKAD